MNQLKKLRFILLLPLFTMAYASPIFTITPNENQVYLRSDGIAVVQWTVTNHAASGTNLVIVANYTPTGLTNGVTIQASTCTSGLAPNGSCKFDTLIQGSLQGGSFQLSPKVCGFNNALCSVPATFLSVDVVPVQSPAYAYLGVGDTDHNSNQNELLPIAVSSNAIGTAAQGFYFNETNGVTTSFDGSKIYSANEQVVSMLGRILYPLTLRISARPSSLTSAPQLLANLELPTPPSYNALAPRLGSGVSRVAYLAVTRDDQMVYMDWYQYNIVYVINVKDPTHPLVSKSLTGFNGPAGIVINPSGTKVYVACQDSIAVIDTVTNTLESTVTVPGVNYGIAITPDGNTLYVTHQDNTISVINTQSFSVQTVTLPIIDSDGVAISPDGKKAYITDIENNQIAVMDTSNIDTPPTIISIEPANNKAAGIAIAPDGSKAFVITINDGENPLAVIDLTNPSLISYPPLNIGSINTNQLGNFVG